MSHDEFDADVFEGSDERFADWVDGRLSSEQVEAFEEELAADDELRRQAEEYRDTVDLLRRHLQPDEPPADLVPNVMAQLPGAPTTGRLVPFLASLTAAAAMFMLYVVLSDMTAGPEVNETPNVAAPSEENELADDADGISQKDAREFLKLDVKGVELDDGKKDVAKIELGAAAEAPPIRSVGDEHLAIGLGKNEKMRRDQDAFRPVVGRKELDRDFAKTKKSVLAVTESKGGGELEKQNAGKRDELARKSKADGAVRQRPNPDPMAGRNAPPGLPKPVSTSDGPAATSAVGAEVRRMAVFYLHEVQAQAPGKTLDAEVAGEARQRRQAGGFGRRPVAENAATQELPVLVLDVPSMAHNGVVPNTGILDEITKESDKARLKSKSPKKGIGRKPSKSEGKNVGGRVGADEKKSRGRRRSVGQPKFKRPKSHALLMFLDTRDTGNVIRADALELTMLSPADLFASGVRDPVKKGQKDAAKSKAAVSRNAGDYAYQTGDEVFAVSGDRQQVQQFFVGLRDYLASRSQASGRLAKKPMPKRSRIPVRLRRLAESGPSRATFGRALLGRAQASGQFRFLVVLRPRR